MNRKVRMPVVTGLVSSPERVRNQAKESNEMPRKELRLRTVVVTEMNQVKAAKVRLVITISITIARARLINPA
jgi:hypothetical protein